MTRILAVVPSLGGGGAEKHMLRVLNALDKNYFHVTVAMARAGGVFERELEKGINTVIFGLTLNSSTLGIIGGIPKLRKLIVDLEPDIIWSILPLCNLAAIQAVPPTGKKRFSVVISEQVSLNLELGIKSKGLAETLFLPARKKFYPRADAVVALSNGVAKELEYYIPALGNRLKIIHNACVDGDVYELSRKSPDNPSLMSSSVPVILSCGRLVWQKDYPTLLRAFVRLRERIPANLVIIGDGPLRSYLNNLIDELGIKDYVNMPGFKDNPYAYMSWCSLFVLSSVSEGFGNVIAEAMASGAPVVATDCPHGPRDIITHNQNGLLVPPSDPDALADAMVKVLEDRALQKTMVVNARISAERFTSESIANKYARLFESLAT